MITFLIIFLGNRALSNQKLGENIARKSGLIANLVLDALNGDHLVQITTTRGKVYIGWILLGPGISREGKVEDVAVAPLFSGHRDPDTQKFTPDIDYSLALFKLAELLEKDDDELNTQIPKRPEMSVVIPMGEIALIRRHNDELDEFFYPMN